MSAHAVGCHDACRSGLMDVCLCSVSACVPDVVLRWTRRCKEMRSTSCCRSCWIVSTTISGPRQNGVTGCTNLGTLRYSRPVACSQPCTVADAVARQSLNANFSPRSHTDCVPIIWAMRRREISSTNWMRSSSSKVRRSARQILSPFVKSSRYADGVVCPRVSIVKSLAPTYSWSLAPSPASPPPSRVRAAKASRRRS